MFNDLKTLKSFALAIVCFGLAYWLIDAMPERLYIAGSCAVLGAAYLLIGAIRLFMQNKSPKK